MYVESFLEEDRPAEEDDDAYIAPTDTYRLRLLVPPCVALAFTQDENGIVRSVREKCKATIEVSETTVPEGVISMTCPMDTMEECLSSLIYLLTQHGSNKNSELRLLVHRVHDHFICGNAGSSWIQLKTTINLGLQALNRPDAKLDKHILDCPRSMERVIIVQARRDVLAGVIKIIMDHIAKNIPPLNKAQIGMLYDPSCLAHLPPRTARLYGGYEQEDQQMKIERTKVELTIPNWLAKQSKELAIRNLMQRLRYQPFNVQVKMNLKQGQLNDESSTITIKGTPHEIQAAVFRIKKYLKKKIEGVQYLGYNLHEIIARNRKYRDEKWWAKNEHKITPPKTSGKSREDVHLDTSAHNGEVVSKGQTVCEPPQTAAIVSTKASDLTTNTAEIATIKAFPLRFQVESTSPKKFEEEPIEKLVCPNSLGQLAKMKEARTKLIQMAKKKEEDVLTKEVQDSLADERALKVIRLKQDSVGKVFLLDETVLDDESKILVKVPQECVTLLEMDNCEIFNKIKMFTNMNLNLKSADSNCILLTFRGPHKSVKNAMQMFLKSLRLKKAEKRIVKLQQEQEQQLNLPAKGKKKKRKSGGSESPPTVQLEDVQLDGYKAQLQIEA